MSKFYVSFGQNHIHKLDHAVIDNNCIVELEAENTHIARNAADELFNCKFSILYDHIPNMKYFSRGIFDIFGNKLKTQAEILSNGAFV